MARSSHSDPASWRSRPGPIRPVVTCLAISLAIRLGDVEESRLSRVTCPQEFIPIANGDFLGLDLPHDFFI